MSQGLIDTASEAIECIERACHQIMSAERLHKVLAVVLTVGNTLNWGTHRGNANGVRLESLHKLADMKVSQPSPHCLHQYFHSLSLTRREHTIAVIERLRFPSC